MSNNKKELKDITIRFLERYASKGEVKQTELARVEIDSSIVWDLKEIQEVIDLIESKMSPIYGELDVDIQYFKNNSLEPRYYVSN
jgi:hypothetical protein